MQLFIKTIKKYQKNYNFHQLLKALLIIISLTLVLANLYFIFHSQTSHRFYELFLFGLSLKIVLGLLILYVILQTNNSLINRYQSARLIDKFNEDKDDSYQNALELLETEGKKNPQIIGLICATADKKAESQIIPSHLKKLSTALQSLGLLLITSLIFAILLPQSYSKAWQSFLSNSVQQPIYSDVILVSPGNISTTKYSQIVVEVIEPEQALSYNIHYSIGENWRTEALYQFKKQFNNLDYDLRYYISNDYAVSDTFMIKVFEEPAVKEMTLRYTYPEYTGLQSITEHNSNGNIRAIKNSYVNIRIEANNPLQEALMIFTNGEVLTMERLGREVFQQDIMVENSGSYHLKLTDFLNNDSRRLDRSITMLPDKIPEIKIVYPGRDTLFTQNMLQRLKFFASDDFGLKNLVLNYKVNENELNRLNIMQNIPSITIDHDYIFDLTGTYMLPGDVVTYWAEISDNAPVPQLAVSAVYRLRFPSVEEIFAEIQKEEELKMEAFKNSIELSEQLQLDFEQKRRELMKKNEFDWEDKQDMEKFLDRQEELNKAVESLAEEYDKLLEKFEENPFLSDDTLDKMEKIKQLMEEIADEQLKNVMEKMRNAMEEMNRDEMLKMMEDFKFSMEDFNKKLEQTLDLLESIKKEQNLQKALAISKEMEQMQEKLLERTEGEAASSEQLAAEQETIKEKYENLQEQLETLKDMLDEQKDSQLLDAIEKMQEESEGLSDDLEQSAQNLKSKNSSASAQNQKNALSKMKKMTSQMEEMSESMMQGAMGEMVELVQKSIRRLLALSLEHQAVSSHLSRDPFPIYPDLIAGFDSIQLALQKLYSLPEIVLFITPKFVMDSDMTINAYREMFHHITNSRNPNISRYLDDIQKGINMMIHNLIQTADNMSEGGGGGMESLMQALQQMGQEQMGLNMITQQLMEQMGGSSGMTREMREQMQRIASEEDRLAENLRRLLETSPEAQKQASTINQLIEELQSISRQLRQNRLDESLLRQQERILSRLLDAQKSINQREFSRRRQGETREEDLWELPPDIQQEFQKLRQQALLQENLNSFPKEYQDLIREYLKNINRRANEQ